jgi:hypothetical protein
MSDDVKRELNEAIDRILASRSPKKLVVAGRKDDPFGNY